MKIPNRILPWLSIAAASVLFSACGGGDSPETVTRAAPGVAEAPQPVTSITITGNDLMQFDKTEFAVRAGTEITVVFHNIGQLPKEAMGHNLAILDKSVDPMAFSNAAMRHAANEYIPPEYEDRVIAATKVLGPGERETITFTAPSEPGDYPFVCSFPGHTPAGMRGIMKVLP